MAVQSGGLDLVTVQLGELQTHFAGAVLEPTSDGQRLLAVHDLALPPGWTKEHITLRVLVPAGFPHVKPDCFYTDPDLRLSGGAEPTNSAVQDVFGTKLRWFSYHLGSWDPLAGSLHQYVRFCHRRFYEVR